MNDLNKQAAESIVQMIEHDPIIFIGSGLSIPPYNSWKSLLDELSTRMGINVQNKQDLILAAQELYKSNPEQYLDKLKSIFFEAPQDCRYALRDIVTIDFKAFLTTNFDQTIEFAFRLANLDLPEILAYPNLQASLCLNQSIHYVHGRISENSQDPQEIIFHEESYQNAYYQDNKIASYLFDVLFANNVLFTGFGLSESEPLNHVFEAVIKTMDRFNKTMDRFQKKKSLPKRHWKILLSQESLALGVTNRLDRLNIEVIPFDKVNKNYQGLDDVWKLVLMKVKSEMPMRHTEVFNPLQPMEESDWA